MPFPSVPSIRPLVIGIIRRGEAILVNRGFDHQKQQSFYRPLGGGIEFGETCTSALEREFQEELGVGLHNIRVMGWIENIFVYEGKPGHEIVAVCEAEFADSRLYNKEYLYGREGESEFNTQWLELSHCSEQEPLYPVQLAEFLQRVL